MMLLDNAAALELLSDIISVAKVVGILIALGLAFLGGRLLLKLRRPQEPRQWLGFIARGLGGMLLLLPAIVWLFSMQFDRTDADREAAKVAAVIATNEQASRVARQVAFTGEYTLNPATSTAALRRFTIHLFLNADSTYQMSTTVPKLDSFSEGRWLLKHGTNGKVTVALTPRGARQALYELDSYGTLAVPYLEGRTPTTPRYRFRLLKRTGLAISTTTLRD